MARIEHIILDCFVYIGLFLWVVKSETGFSPPLANDTALTRFQHSCPERPGYDYMVSVSDRWSEFTKVNPRKTNSSLALGESGRLKISYKMLSSQAYCNSSSLSDESDVHPLTAALLAILGPQKWVFTVPARNLTTALDCPGGCSISYDCDQFYDCFFQDPWPAPEYRRDFSSRLLNFEECMLSNDPLSRNRQIGFEAECPFIMQTIDRFYASRSTSSATTGCIVSAGSKDTGLNWKVQNTDDNLNVIRNGGRDSEGLWWSRPNLNTTANAVEVFVPKMIGSVNFACSLEAPCAQTLQCDSVGSRTAVGFGIKNAGILPSSWGVQIVNSIMNINRQLTNQYNALQGGAISTALEAFTVDDFFPQKKDPPKFLKALTGIGTAFGAIAGFLPGVGSAVAGTVGTILPAISSEIEGAISGSASSLKEQATDSFSTQVKEVYTQLVAALDDTANTLLKGQNIGNFSIFDMMKGGAWLDASRLTPIKNAERQMKLEIMSRGINLLWGSGSGNKRWVLFTDLKDFDAGGKPITDACRKDTSGPPSTKYCADGGVYYTYNYVEGSKARLDFPWGADKFSKIDSNFNISFATEGSARLYQLAQNKTYNIDPFNPNATAVSAAFFETYIQADSVKSLDGMAGKYPGSWSLPVCNGSTWGKYWNKNYESKSDKKDEIPCFCGVNGTETAAWAKAAGMENFKTYLQGCSSQLVSRCFTWPPGVTQVDIGSGVKVSKPTKPENFVTRIGDC